MVIRVDTDIQLKDPKVVTLLFSDTRMSLVWLIARVYLGWQWLDGGHHKVTSAEWMEGGQALKASWERIVAQSDAGSLAIRDGWYREWIRFMLDNEWYSWCGKLVAVGEVVVGLALILGLLTGGAALLGWLLTVSVVLGGVGSLNPLGFVLALGLMAAWKTAGTIGLDAFVLPKPSAPWPPGLFWRRIRPGVRPDPV